MPKEIFVESAEELWQWLSKNYRSRESVWLIRWKKGSGYPAVAYDDVVDICLSFGWIDSLPRKLDSKRTMLRISPRRPSSNWSKVNRERVERLITSKRMHPHGMRLVEDAKKNGRWSFLDEVEALLIPDDLRRELRRYPGATRHFERFPRSSKRGILEWIQSAKTEATRRRRIDETARKAAANRKANHPRGRDRGPKEA